jgi:hypothetical protein
MVEAARAVGKRTANDLLIGGNLTVGYSPYAGIPGATGHDTDIWADTALV